MKWQNNLIRDATKVCHKMKNIWINIVLAFLRSQFSQQIFNIKRQIKIIFFRLIYQIMMNVLHNVISSFSFISNEESYVVGEHYC